MESAQATLRFLRMSPRKVRLVADMVRGQHVDTALAQLWHNKKAASRPVRKLIESAAANAVNNHNLERSALIIQTITVDDGPTMKRFMPRAHGRATMLRKRSSHLRVVVAEDPKRVTKKEAAPADKPEKKATKKAPASKAAPKKPAAKKKSTTKKTSAASKTKKQD